MINNMEIEKNTTNGNTIESMFPDLLQSLEGMLESYDVLMNEVLPHGSVCHGCVTGAFIGEPKRARQLIKQARDMMNISKREKIAQGYSKAGSGRGFTRRFPVWLINGKAYVKQPPHDIYETDLPGYVMVNGMEINGKVRFYEVARNHIEVSPEILEICRATK